MSKALDDLAQRVKTEPGFLAFLLTEYQRCEALDDDGLRRRLTRPGWPTIGPHDFTRLLLCGVPRHRDDIELIAERFAIDPDRLAAICGL